MKFTPLLLVLLLPQVTPRSVFRTIVPMIVKHVESDARTAAREGLGSGPLIIDLQNFVTQGRLSSDSTVAAIHVARAIGREFLDITRADAVRSKVVSLENPQWRDYWIVDDGVFIWLDSLKRTRDKVTAFATSLVTDRRPSGASAVCLRKLKLVFELRNKEWVLSRKQLLETC